MGKYFLESNCARIINLLTLINILMSFPAIHFAWLFKVHNKGSNTAPVSSLMLSTKTQAFSSNVVVMTR